MSTVKLKRGTTANWTSQDLVLADGQPGVETTSSGTRLKIGDGTSKWSSLKYVNEDLYLKLSGGTLESGNFVLNVGSGQGKTTLTIMGGGAGKSALQVNGSNVITAQYLSAYDVAFQSELSNYLPLSGGTMTGAIKVSEAGGIWSQGYPTMIGGYGTIQLYDTHNGIVDAHSSSNAKPVVLKGISTPTSSTDAANKSYVDTQVATKQATITGGASTITSSNLTANRALVSSSSGKVTVSTVTSTQLGYLSGVTSSIQTQLNNKASSSHTHNNYLPGYNASTHTIDLNLGSSNLNFEDPINFEQGVRCGGYLTVSGGPLYVSGKNYPHIRNASGTEYVTIGTDTSNQLVIYGGTVRPGGDVQQNLGYSNHRWATIYAANGTIQTSDRSEKSDIHYIKDSTTSIMKTMSLNADTTDNDNKYEYSYDNLLEFIDKLNPVVFSYGKDGIDASLSDNHMDQTQLGLIADDIQDEELFKFVGASIEDDEGKTHLGLKAVPLAVLALSACKNLLQRVKQLESK